MTFLGSVRRYIFIIWLYLAVHDLDKILIFFIEILLWTISILIILRLLLFDFHAHRLLTRGHFRHQRLDLLINLYAVSSIRLRQGRREEFQISQFYLLFRYFKLLCRLILGALNTFINLPFEVR